MCQGRGSLRSAGWGSDEIVRKYYSGWKTKDWSTIESLLAADFTFTSPNNDDHIDQHAFKKKCWPEAGWIEHFEVEVVIGQAEDVFAKYLCQTKEGKLFRNTEYFRITDGKIRAIECYFGGQQGYPSRHAAILPPEIAPDPAS
jgi:ketosteroid isomerase-like protein